jgi:O2-independent ubiquinone biosynthesis protein UbiU
MDLVCPAGSLPALKAAVDNGADAVYIGFRDDTNARNFPGLNFDVAAAREGVAYAHARGRQVLVAINTFPQTARWERATRAVDTAAGVGVDAVIIADTGLMHYAATRQPQLSRHLSVQGSATNYEAINFYREQFGIARAILPRVLSFAQVQQVIAGTAVEIELFAFGSLCVMVEGRCVLSSYVTGESPNTLGACSPPHAVRWQQQPHGLETRLNGILINCYGTGEHAAYPTICKGRYRVGGEKYYAIEEPASLNALDLLPQIVAAGIAAIKIEGRQRSPTYVGQATRIWRAAIDACTGDGAHSTTRPEWAAGLRKLAEGQQHTLGAYHRPWK